MKKKKRILSVTIKRMLDDSPDTSWLGEYGPRPKSDYAIDRAHSEDCASVDPSVKEAKEKLERMADYLESVSLDCEHATWHGDCSECAEMMDAHDTLTELAQNLDDCDCSRHWSGREYRYFNACAENYEGLPDADIRKYCRQDYERMESLQAGHFCFIGIRAQAEITFTPLHPLDPGQTQTITSGGLWGIESDSGNDYLESVEKEELSNLKDQLKALGFSSRAISTAFKTIERKED